MLQDSPNASTSGGPEMKRFEQVFSDGHQMSVSGMGPYSEVPCLVFGPELGGPCAVRSNESYIMVTWEPLPTS